jgi:Tfp pilus assembly protein PilV
MKGETNDRGETLVELLVAVMIMGVTVVSIVGAVVTSILMPDVHRKQATAGVHVRNYAEAIETAVVLNGYVATCTPGYATGFAPPGYTSQIVAVSFWNGTSFPSPCNAATDIGLQQLTLQVSSSDGRATETLVVVVRNSCGPGTSCT